MMKLTPSLSPSSSEERLNRLHWRPIQRSKPKPYQSRTQRLDGSNPTHKNRTKATPRKEGEKKDQQEDHDPPDDNNN